MASTAPCAHSYRRKYGGSPVTVLPAAAVFGDDPLLLHCRYAAYAVSGGAPHPSGGAGYLAADRAPGLAPLRLQPVIKTGSSMALRRVDAQQEAVRQPADVRQNALASCSAPPASADRPHRQSNPASRASSVPAMHQREALARLRIQLLDDDHRAFRSEKRSRESGFLWRSAICRCNHCYETIQCRSPRWPGDNCRNASATPQRHSRTLSLAAAGMLRLQARRRRKAHDLCLIELSRKQGHRNTARCCLSVRSAASVCDESPVIGCQGAELQNAPLRLPRPQPGEKACCARRRYSLCNWLNVNPGLTSHRIG